MNRLTLKTFLMVLCGLLVSTTLFAQRTVRGTVTDPSGEPVIGAAVLVSGTTQGTITEVDGSYSISVPAGAALEFVEIRHAVGVIVFLLNVKAYPGDA